MDVLSVVWERIAEGIIWERLTEVAIKGVDCVRHYHMEIVKKKSTLSFWEFFSLWIDSMRWHVLMPESYCIEGSQKTLCLDL